jgi:hypothetical protein
MEKLIKQKIGIKVAAAVLLTVSVWYGITALGATSTERMRHLIDTKITDQESRLNTLADLTRQNKADATTERIIIDCKPTDRNRFDVLLDRLSGEIGALELDELDSLFYKCGHFYANQKAVMSGQLIREVTVYADYVDLRNNLIAFNNERNTTVQNWQQLAEAELQTAEYFNQLVTLQGIIIAALRAGQNSTSPEVIKTLAEVQNIRGQMLVLGKQIENYRAALVML